MARKEALASEMMVDLFCFSTYLAVYLNFTGRLLFLLIHYIRTHFNVHFTIASSSPAPFFR